MSQCKKTINGQRCSNRAVPGTEFCEEHSSRIANRIMFRPAPPASPTNSPSSEVDSLSSDTLQKLIAIPSAAGEPPRFPGLSADARNILVGRQAVIWLCEGDALSTVAGIFPRLANLLACLSQEISLSGHVKIWMTSERRDVLLLLTPPAELIDLSRFYDMVSDVATLNDGLLYIGETPYFVQYRDANTPRGYDAPVPPTFTEPIFYFVDWKAVRTISFAKLSESNLSEILLQISPVPTRHVVEPEVAYVLVKRPLYRLLARYFHAHRIQFRVARFHSHEKGDFILFRIAPRMQASSGSQVPVFVLSYLQGLPCCTILGEVATESSRRMLVEWTWQFPCLPSNILDAFPQDALIIITANRDHATMCVSPAPPFFDQTDFAVLCTSLPGPSDYQPLFHQEGLPVELPVSLVADSGPAAAPMALILDAEETEWLTRLLFRLPGQVFGAYRLCLGVKWSVLMSETLPIESLPFGIPLRRIQDTCLFIPQRTRIEPDISLELLAKVLELRDDTYTFFSSSFRIDVSRSDFIPLTRMLVGDPDRPRVQMEVRSCTQLPMLQWKGSEVQSLTEPTRTINPSVESKRKFRTPKQFIARISRSTDTKVADVEVQNQSVSDPANMTQSEPASATTLEALHILLREKAEMFQKTEDFLSAALCYAIIGDEISAAQCYIDAARNIQKGRHDVRDDAI